MKKYEIKSKPKPRKHQTTVTLAEMLILQKVENGNQNAVAMQ
jgi:hypothetical protein